MVKIIRKHWSIFAKIFFLLFFFVALGFSAKFFFSNPLPARSSWLATTTWKGGATGNWQNAANWTDGIPSSTALADISSSTAITITATGTINFDTLRIGGGTASSTLILVGNIGSGVDIDIQNNGKLTQSSTAQQNISGTLHIESGGRLTHSANTSTQARIINFNTNTTTLDSGGIIIADGLGYAGGVSNGGAGQGPGGGKGAPYSTTLEFLGGGGHGGNGGNATSSGLGYCDITSINTIGSGGGASGAAAGGAGGGLIILSATGTVTINGSITANGNAGANNNAGGGAGGGIKITADIITGTPSNFSASGGNAQQVGSNNGGSGGGGCVDLFYTTSNTITPTSSYFSVYGGTVSYRGSGGMAFVKQTGVNNGDLYVLNNGLAIDVTQPSSTVPAITADSIYVSSTVFQVTSSKTFTLVNSDPFSGNGLGEIRVYGTMSKSGGFTSIHDVALTVESAGSVAVSSTFTASSTLNLYKGFIGIGADMFTNLIIQSGTTTLYNYNTTTVPLAVKNLTMNSSSVLTSATNTTGQVNILYVTASSSITINAGATVLANAGGYAAGGTTATGSGPGGGGVPTSSANGGGGGAHGGNGGAGKFGGGVGGTAYCSSTNPTTIGSGGGGGTNAGGAGGGLIWLSATGTMTISGSIKANGNNGAGNTGGGGGGGGIKLIAQTVSGTPQSFTANGGNGLTTGGGGGGGCIFIQYTTANSVTSSVATTTGGTSGTGTAGSAGTFQTSQVAAPNSAPTVTAIFPNQTSTNIVAVTTTIADTDLNITSLAIFYSTDGATWVSSTIANVTENVAGSVSTSTSTGIITGIDTDNSGSVNLTFEWNVGADLANTEDSSVYIKITPNDGTVDGTAVSSTAFSIDTKAPTAPGNLSVSATTTQSVTLKFGSAATDLNFREYKIFYKAGSSGVSVSDMAFTSSSDSNLGPINYGGAANTTISGLATSTQYVANIWAYDGFSRNTAAASEVTFYTLAATSSAPTLSGQTTTTLDVAITSGDTNPSTVEYAIQETGSNNYVQSDGTLGASAAWATRSSWGTKTVTGLTANSQYIFKVKARNGNNIETAFSATSSATTLANNVTSLVATNTTITSTYRMGLSWTNAGQTGMKLERDNSCNGTYDVTLFDNTAANDSSPTTTLSNLQANTCYRFRISSYNSAGNLNSTNVTVSNDVTMPPAAPTNVTVVNVTTSTITWGWDAVTGATTYYVYNTNNVLLDTVSVTSSLQTGLSVSTSYSVFVRAANANGTGVSSSIATAVTGPAAPTGLAANSRTTSTITWGWTNGGQYQFFARDKNNTADNSGWITSSTWVQSSLATNTAYTLQVKARDVSSTESGYTEITRYTAQAVPTSISFISSTANSITAVINGGFVNLGVGSSLINIENGAGGTQSLTNTTTWNNSGLNPGTQYNFSASATNGDGLQTASTTGSKYTLAATPVAPTVLTLSSTTLSIAITAAGDSNSGIVEYAIAETGSGNYIQSNGSLGASAYWAPTSTWGTKTVTGLSINTQYTFKAKARNGENTETSFGSTASVYTYANVPGAPVLGNAATSSLSVTIDTNNNPSYTTYSIYNNTTRNYGAADGSATSTPVWQTTSTWGANYLAKGLSPNTAYQFSVIARNGDNALTATSTTSSAKYTLTSVPSSVVATVDSQTQITLSWTRDATSSYAENTTAGTNSGWISGTSYIFSGLTCGTSYSFRVKAINGDGTETSFSDPVTAATNACNAASSGGTAMPVTTAPTVVVQPAPPIQPTPEISPPPAAAKTVPPPVLPSKPIAVAPSVPQQIAIVPVITLPVRTVVSGAINGPQPVAPIIAPLPQELLSFVDKFPQVRSVISQLGVNQLGGIEKLKSVNITLPGLTTIVGLNQPAGLNVNYGTAGAMPLVNLPVSLADKIPANVVFAQGAGQSIDIGSALSLNEKNNLEQKIDVVSGKPLELTIKPDFPVKQIRGILSYVPTNEQVNAQTNGATAAKSWLFVEPVFAAEKVLSAPLEKKLVLLEFEYTDPDKDGIYTADIKAPVPAGQYKILTIMDYQNPKLGSRQVELVAVVDPEGRVYENVGGRQLIVSGATVTLFQFNPNTQKYAIWPAKNFLQTNPLVTDMKGIYSFLVPDGNYYLKVEAPGYVTYEGKPFTVQLGGGIHTDIELKPKYWGIKILDWKTGLVALLAIFLVYFFLKERRLEKKEKKLEEMLENK